MTSPFSWATLSESAPPSAAVEISAHRVSAAAIEWRGGQPVVAAHAVEPLPEGAVVPSLTGRNVHDGDAAADAVKRVLDGIGRPRRVGLVVPDVVAKISLVRFEHVPARPQDLAQLVRWQVKKAAPFPIEEAQVSFVPGIRAADGQEFLVSAARRDVVQEYEDLCAAAGAHAGIVDLATLNVINAVLAGSPPAADWLLVNVATDYASIALLRGPHVIFFRNRSAGTDGTLADLVHQTTMYYQDRLEGTGLSRVLLAGGSAAAGHQAADVEQLRRGLEMRLGATVDPVDPRAAAALTDRISAAPALLDTLAPLVGVLLRHREAAA
ncbi:MAG TPA: pilus assembly protein PilM [Vicinamibacterales bacterium]|jgi:Tfp pilus assembly PilM family ATPase|nr:pilus assembly protein PilM [Vicinamibacterales bacterium]